LDKCAEFCHAERSLPSLGITIREQSEIRSIGNPDRSGHFCRNDRRLLRSAPSSAVRLTYRIDRPQLVGLRLAIAAIIFFSLRGQLSFLTESIATWDAFAAKTSLNRYQGKMLVGPKSQGGCALAAGFNRAKSRLLSSEVDSEADRHIGSRLNSLIAFIIAPESHSLGAEEFSFRTILCRICDIVLSKGTAESARHRVDLLRGSEWPDFTRDFRDNRIALEHTRNCAILRFLRQHYFEAWSFTVC
jgi:hypothetical protein